LGGIRKLGQIPIKMLGSLLANFYESDLRKLIEEVNAFQQESDLWVIRGSVKNTAGNLALHLAGGLNHFVGATLAHTGYIRHRDEEFSKKGVSRKEIVAQIEQLIPVVTSTLHGMTDEQLEAEYPLVYDNARVSHAYVLVRLLAHLSYHLGQINYLRRMLE
jgi:predicted ATP-grasp superfamily ATP-dependent carboligase